MTASGPLSPGAAPPPGRQAPPSMSVAEKLACEWEARHDVIARGGRLGDPAALAHYCTHTRCEDSRHGHGPQHATHDAAHHARAPQNPLRSWLRWGEDAR
jgi:hypothetical protein